MNATRVGMITLAILAAALATNAHAQLYKWVGPDGKITYSDTPPPKTATKVEKKAISGNGASDVGLPFELAEAARNHPAVLYTSDKCAPCDQGRTFLQARGIPYSEKTVSSEEDRARLQRLIKSTEVPLLIVGRSQIKGFEATAWNDALKAASYPANNMLPKGYQFRPAEPAAPVSAPQPKPEEKKPEPPKPTATPTPTPTGEKAPPGFQF